MSKNLITFFPQSTFLQRAFLILMLFFRRSQCSEKQRKPMTSAAAGAQWRGGRGGGDGDGRGTCVAILPGEGHVSGNHSLLEASKVA